MTYAVTPSQMKSIVIPQFKSVLMLHVNTPNPDMF